jgi:hypothetical protein
MAAVQREESDEALTTGAEQHVPIALRVDSGSFVVGR